MTPIDTRLVAGLPPTVPSEANGVGHPSGPGTQAGRSGTRLVTDTDWFSSARSGEYRSITPPANASLASEVTLDALADKILSHIGEYTPE